MTQAGYLSSRFHDLVAILATASVIDVRGDPNLLGALVGRILPIRPSLFKRLLLLIYGLSEGRACPSIHLLALEHAIAARTRRFGCVVAPCNGASHA
jgi:hypothetical protein